MTSLQPNPRQMPVAELNKYPYFWVPSYQRGYRWGSEEVKALLNDLLEYIDNPTGKTYCLQPVVVKQQTATTEKPEAVPAGESYYELIDGQQRITTLYLLYRYLATQGQPEPGFTLSYETRPGSTGFLRKVSAKIDETNIDYFHMSTAFETIQEWFSIKWPDGTGRRAAAEKWCWYLADQIQLIWFDAGKQDAIDLFTRLNAGRIALTNAELVKALLLADDGDADTHLKTIRAGQWDEIEHALHDNAFWHFLSSEEPQSYPTRIDLLLDLITGEARTRNNSFKTFQWFYDRLKSKKTHTQEELWTDVWQRYTQLRDWFEERPIYHRIGWLVATGERLSVVIKACLHHKDLSKTDFKAFLDGQIQQRLAVQSIDKIDYIDDRKKCEALLLLFNVMSVDAIKHGNERYPFDIHYKERWSLEHIHAQAAPPLDGEEEWSDWLKETKDLLNLYMDINSPNDNDAKLISEMTNALLPNKTIGRDNFQKLEKGLSAMLNRFNYSEDPHAIENLALLSGDINASLGNQSFPAKRLRLLKHDKSGRFIPLCTRRVFLKYYAESKVQELQRWSPGDRKAYRDEILAVVNSYFSKEI